MACYRSAPNDVWSLGVVLVNLTCGRNPWKRASVEDSTFKAFTKDPNFLQTILPVTDECNAMLKRIFDSNPQTRITIPELIEWIERQPRLTQGSTEPMSPPYSPIATTPVAQDAMFCVPEPAFEPLPAARYPIPQHVFAAPQPQHCQMPSPPASVQCSPQPTVYTSQVRSQVPYFQAPVASLPNLANPWSRCGAYLSQFAAPQHHQPYWAFAH